MSATGGRPGSPGLPGGPAYPPRPTPQAPTSEVLNPVEVEQAIRTTVDDIAKSVRGVTEALKDYREKERLYDLAFARAYNRHTGAAHAKRYVAEEQTTQERAERDAAEVVYRYAERRAKALEASLSAYQSVMRSVNQMYGAAGA